MLNQARNFGLIIFCVLERWREGLEVIDGRIVMRMEQGLGMLVKRVCTGGGNFLK